MLPQDSLEETKSPCSFAHQKDCPFYHEAQQLFDRSFGDEAFGDLSSSEEKNASGSRGYLSNDRNFSGSRDDSFNIENKHINCDCFSRPNSDMIVSEREEDEGEGIVPSISIKMEAVFLVWPVH